jgi:hypothetical protein
MQTFILNKFSASRQIQLHHLCATQPNNNNFCSEFNSIRTQTSLNSKFKILTFQFLTLFFIFSPLFFICFFILKSEINIPLDFNYFGYIYQSQAKRNYEYEINRSQNIFEFTKKHTTTAEVRIPIPFSVLFLQTIELFSYTLSGLFFRMIPLKK